MLSLAALIPDVINRNLGWWLFGISIALGVFVGRRDLLRLSWKRMWAISGVCFDESIRRRVLWITPLAIFGVIVVSQLQRPLDEHDAIRQTVKFCLFATGLLVAITTIILACTNLPREIENRVIYTVVTKPTTRLEIVLGKVMGFAKVSLAILLIMGIFSYTYLAVRAWNMRRAITQRLEANEVPATSIATLKYYRDGGLLSARTLEEPDALQVYSRLPEEGDPRRYMFGNGEGSFLIPFDIDPAAITPPGADKPAPRGLMIVAHVGYLRKGGTTQPTTAAATNTAATGPTTVPYYGPFIMSPQQREAIMSGTRPSEEPLVSIEILDSNKNIIGGAIAVPPRKVLELTNRTGLSEVRALVAPKDAERLKGRIFVQVTGVSPNTEYYVDLQRTPMPVTIFTPVTDDHLAPIEQARSALDARRPAPPIFQSRSGTFGQQVRGGTERAPVGIYRFRDANITSSDGMAPFEMRAGVERSGADDPDATLAEDPTQVTVRVRNLTSGKLSDEITVEPESMRTAFFKLPITALEGGNFDVQIRCLTRGDFLGLQPRSIVLITNMQPFGFNLAKSLFVLWLMSVLITTVAIFTSTFLSWPIAVVLTLVILLGHWGVEQLGDATQPGIGRQVVTDFQLKDPAKAEAVRRTVENLSSFLNFISTILPDISRYAAVEDIERGVSIPLVKMRDSLAVTLGFGLPLVLLAYVLLKNKEVAP
jgi:hypothetical protein